MDNLPNAADQPESSSDTITNESAEHPSADFFSNSSESPSNDTSFADFASFESAKEVSFEGLSQSKWKYW